MFSKQSRSFWGLWIPATDPISHRPRLQTQECPSKREAQVLYHVGPEAEARARGPGHEDEEEGVQTGMKAAQTHRRLKVGVQTLPSAREHLHVMEEVQEPGGQEAHEEEDEDQRAGLDVHGPVVV